MDALHMSWDDVMYNISSLNLQLLMIDKLKYVGIDKEKEDNEPSREMTAKEEHNAFSKLKR